MHQALEVVYNGIVQTQFFAQSRKNLIVPIPSSQIGRPLNELVIISTTKLTFEPATVVFQLSRPPQMVSGIDRLVQMFLMELFTTPGSDIFDPKSGGGALALVGRNSGGDRGAVVGLTRAVDAAKRSIAKKQAQFKRVPNEERLLSATLSNVSFNSLASVLSGQIEIKNMSGQSATVGVG